MFETDGLQIDCLTCVAANTTACNDCLVTHLLANDAGPIELVVAPVSRAPDAVDVTVERFVRAGLLDDPPVFVDPEVFAAAGSDAGALEALVGA